MSSLRIFPNPKVMEINLLYHLLHNILFCSFFSFFFCVCVGGGGWSKVGDQASSLVILSICCVPQIRPGPWERRDRKGTVLSSRSNNLFVPTNVFLKRSLRTACVTCHPLCQGGICLSVPCPCPALSLMLSPECQALF